MPLIETWLDLYETKADALRDLNATLDKDVRSNRLYEWLDQDSPRFPPRDVQIYMRQQVLANVLKSEGIGKKLTTKNIKRIVEQLS